VALCKARPNRERAKACPEDLSFQSYTQHATLFLTRCNTEIVFSVFFIGEWVRAHLVGSCLAGDHLGAGSGQGGKSGERNPKQTVPRYCAGRGSGRVSPRGWRLRAEEGHTAGQEEHCRVRSDSLCRGPRAAWEGMEADGGRLRRCGHRTEFSGVEGQHAVRNLAGDGGGWEGDGRQGRAGRRSEGIRL